MTYNSVLEWVQEEAKRVVDKAKKLSDAGDHEKALDLISHLNDLISDLANIVDDMTTETYDLIDSRLP